MSFLPRSLNRVLTVDYEMPRMDGLTFLKQLMQTQPLPVILISSLAQSSCEIALTGLRLGAVDVLAKPSGPYSVGDLRPSLAGRVRAAARAKLRQTQPAGASAATAVSSIGPASSLGLSAVGLSAVGLSASPAAARKLDHVVAIGASTGGVERLRPC